MGPFLFQLDFFREARLRRFLATLFSCLKFLHLFHRRLLVVFTGTIFFHNSVSITKALELFECAFNSEPISNVDADFVFGIFFLVSQWDLSKSWCFKLFGKIAHELKKARVAVSFSG
jgi:hypothetical protein